LLLKSIDNAYGGTLVLPEDLPATTSGFISHLNESLSLWKAHQIKVVWIKVPSSRSELLAVLYKAGFNNHHCDKDTITLTLALMPEAFIPHPANHSIGVGGLVINQNNELLTIIEKGHVKTHPHHWKLPGGMIDPKEHIEQAVMREVLEETGIETVFESFIGFRHHHKGQFNASNIYAVCKLKPLSHEITIQESEIADAKWIAVDEYLADDRIAEFNKNIVRTAQRYNGLKKIEIDGYMQSGESEIFTAF
jgi:8-oxo-dGTP diphosphatase